MNFGQTVELLFYGVPLVAKLLLTEHTIFDTLKLVLLTCWCTLYCARIMYVSNECTNTALEVNIV